MQQFHFDFEHINIVCFVNTQNGNYRLMVFSNLDLLAIKLACIMTDMSFSEIMQTPQFYKYLQDVNEKYSNASIM